ncbi:Gfo/Idh/MocA family oxidoreductase [Chitinophagaceae bacterium LB-8]|uniref:Gfo/Idh/MocA family oxidoreductase n=1 Tax=Paraflavisolibacter caeni TaxID=2982496 RepID=A0A9X3BHR4_9BACT|nr:Gfo/Idh/MocA family oxidoreductase [Paraflavisolibacter caeni]MCU7550087.1 Gfo/Idh/MocA family oxidoreductase [Paraflavisolibacter caeni]
MSYRKINVAIVGLGFGAEFIPIYQRHSNANMYAICQRNVEKLNEVGDAFGVEKRYTDFDELLKDPAIDAVHINTPIQNHAEQSLKALRAGKHVACTVPMATTVEECRLIVEAVKETGLTYMMMETVVYSREFLFVKEMYESGAMGKLQFLRASHQQEMAGWPGYWEGLPPMHYATHCVAPVVALAKADAEYVSCFGSGRIDEDLISKYGSPFAIESCHIQFRNSDLAAEVTRSLFNTARQYRESFDVYGSKKSFEWTLVEHEDPIIHIGEKPERVKVPDYARLLPSEIQSFTTGGVYDADSNQHLSFIQGAGHGGSHPHLVHEFISSLIDKRQPFPNARQSANITCVGILAHESAMQGGKQMYLPEFTLSLSPDIKNAYVAEAVA